MFYSHQLLIPTKNRHSLEREIPLSFASGMPPSKVWEKMHPMQPIRHPHWDYYCQVVLFELSYFVLESELQNRWINATPVRGMSGKWVTLAWSVGLVVSFQLDNHMMSHKPLNKSNCCYNHGIRMHLSSTFKQNWVESAKQTDQTATTFTSRRAPSK